MGISNWNKQSQTENEGPNCVLVALGFPQFPEFLAARTKRDVTCATGGHRGCNWSCKLRGWASGECSWNMTTAAYNCDCTQERRGIRCNVGGGTTCHLSCVAAGHTAGVCDNEFNCNCSGVNNRWGEVIDNVRDRLK